MAKAKVMVISGPMDAKHVGGVNVMSGSTQSIGIDSYFKNTTLEPDETPSHTFVATGNIEVPRRSDTIANTIRQPSLSIKRSISKLRRKSISHMPNVHHRAEPEQQGETSIGRTASTTSHRPVRMQSSISRLRQRVGLDRDQHANGSTPNASSQEPEITPQPLQKDVPPLRIRRSISRFALRSTSTTPEPESSSGSRALQRQPSYSQRQPPVIQRRPSPIEPEPSAVQRRPFPVDRKPASSSAPVAPKILPPSRPKRVDSGTAVDLDDLPVNERPLGFKAILEVRSFEDRMKHYERARHYWAHAEHGLGEWTQAAVVPRVAARRG